LNSTKAIQQISSDSSVKTWQIFQNLNFRQMSKKIKKF